MCNLYTINKLKIFLYFFMFFHFCIDKVLIFTLSNNNKTQNKMKKVNSLLTISSVLIACASLFFAMFGQFEAMLIGLTLSFIISSFIYQ